MVRFCYHRKSGGVFSQALLTFGKILPSGHDTFPLTCFYGYFITVYKKWTEMPRVQEKKIINTEFLSLCVGGKDGILIKGRCDKSWWKGFINVLRVRFPDPFWHAWLNGLQKKKFPLLRYGSTDKEDIWKYLILHHSQETTQLKVLLKFNIALVQWNICSITLPSYPFYLCRLSQSSLAGQGPSVCLILLPNPPIQLAIQTHTDKLSAAASADKAR